ncbi:MAG TPA: YIP1 family protein [Candidatus Binatia bacterium]
MNSSIAQRMVRAAKLDVHTFEEVEADEKATSQALGVVVLAAIAAGIGTKGGGLVGILIGSLVALASWYIWAYITYWIGTKLLAEPGTRASHGELLRTIGFSASPGLLRILGVIPPVREIVFLVAGIWMLVAMIIAVRTALDYTSTWRAVGVCAIGWIIQAIFLALMLTLLGMGRPDSASF